MGIRSRSQVKSLTARKELVGSVMIIVKLPMVTIFSKVGLTEPVKSSTVTLLIPNILGIYLQECLGSIRQPRQI